MEPILSLISGLPTGTPAAFEAAFGTEWLVELLEDYGFTPHLVHPSRGGKPGSCEESQHNSQARTTTGHRGRSTRSLDG